MAARLMGRQASKLLFKRAPSCWKLFRAWPREAKTQIRMSCKAQERPDPRFLRLRTEFEQASSPVINTFLICVLLQRTKNACNAHRRF